MLAVHVLGRVEVVRDGSPVDLGGPQQRAVIAHLAVDAGRVVSVDRLIDRLWGDELPRTPLGTLQSYVSRLRRAIEPERSVGSAPRVLVSEAPGYMLRIPSDQIDVHRFASLVGEARIASSGADHRLALDRLDAALALWHGPALAGVGPDEQVRPLAARFEEEHQSAVEDRFDVLLALGRHAGAVPALQSAVDEHPLRERRWSQLALALYRSSRQADALRALSTARSTLLDELGLDPGPELRVLEQRILAHDPALMVDRVVDRPPVVLAPPHEVNTPQLVGRSTEWEALLGALDRTSADGARLLLLDGEPGIGKSTLCEALLAHATTTGWHTAVGRCVESGLAPSLWPCIEVVRALVAAAAETTGPPSSPLGQLVAADRRSPTPLSRVEMADQFVALLDELGDVPRVIVLDDLHWADRATLDVVALVLERLGRRRVLVVGAYRPPELVPGSLLGEALGPLARPIAVIRIPMSPLDVAGVARLMQVTTGSTPSGEVAKLVHHRAGGNPLFVAELARLAGERGLDASSAVPDAVRDVVRSRLALLPEGTSAELQLAAIMGERFDVRTLLAASERDPDACLDALDAAIVTRILVADGDEWRFAHALVRDAVMAEISPLRQARLHHRVADAILATHGDGPDRAEPIAHHRLASSAIGDPIVVARAAIRASDVARWRGALDAAESLSERALEVLAGATRSPVVDEAVVEALEALAGAAFRRGREDDRAVVAARVDAIAHRVGSDDARALALYLNWGEIDEVDDLTEVLARTERARALAASTASGYALVLTHYMLGSADFLTGRLREASEHIDAALRATGAYDADDRPHHIPLPGVPVVAAVVAAASGDAGLARDHAHRRAAAWMEERSAVDHTTVVALAFARAMVHGLLDEPECVLEHVRGVDQVDTERVIAFETTTCDVLAGWARARTGDPDGLVAAFSALARIDAGIDRVLNSCMRTFVADACLRLDDPRAVDLLDLAHGEALSRGEVWWLAETLRLRAAADRRFGDGSRAAAWLEEAERLAEAQPANLVLARVRADRHVLVADSQAS